MQGEELQPHSPFVGWCTSSSRLAFGSKSHHLPAASSCDGREGQESSTLTPVPPRSWLQVPRPL